LLEIETLLNVYQEKCCTDPSAENIEQLEILQSKYDRHFDYLSKGAIIRSRASWYETGEKSNKYFLSLESCNLIESNIEENGQLFSKTCFGMLMPSSV